MTSKAKWLKVGDRLNTLVLISRVNNVNFNSGEMLPLWLVKCDCGFKFKATNRAIKRYAFCRGCGVSFKKSKRK